MHEQKEGLAKKINDLLDRIPFISKDETIRKIQLSIAAGGLLASLFAAYLGIRQIDKNNVVEKSESYKTEQYNPKQIPKKDVSKKPYLRNNINENSPSVRKNLDVFVEKQNIGKNQSFFGKKEHMQREYFENKSFFNSIGEFFYNLISFLYSRRTFNQIQYERDRDKVYAIYTLKLGAREFAHKLYVEEKLNRDQVINKLREFYFPNYSTWDVKNIFDRWRKKGEWDEELFLVIERESEMGLVDRIMEKQNKSMEKLKY